MREVYKFGGASVKNAEAVRKVVEIITASDIKLIIVVSAMGKTTNKLEEILHNSEDLKNQSKLIDELIQFHLDIIHNLQFTPGQQLKNQLASLTQIVSNTKSLKDFARRYDEVVSWGELTSTCIISAYMHVLNMDCKWLDARKIIRTDSSHQFASVDWTLTKQIIQEELKNTQEKYVITQGFIAGTADGTTTTLGREGSDYTASIVASCLNSPKVTTWKDVDGIQNADPKRFTNTLTYKYLSYQEAAELTYYGARVIHPKTIQPLSNQNIPLQVRSFLDTSREGTLINQYDQAQNNPAIITKRDQMMITFHTGDLSFITEKNLSIVFYMISKLGITLNLIQMGATSFSICIDNTRNEGYELIERLKNDFKVRFNDSLELFTIRKYNKKIVDDLTAGKRILLEQISRYNYQFVTKTE